jgi:hypothetical protein
MISLCLVIQLTCTHLALGQLRLDCWPGFTLRSITEQVHDDSSLADGLIHLKEVLSWDPTIPGHSLDFRYSTLKGFHTVVHPSTIVHSSERQ